MAIPKSIKANFGTMLRAAAAGHLAVMEGRDAKTGEVRYMIAAVAKDGEEYAITPFGHLSAGNPYEEYIPPTVKEER